MRGRHMVEGFAALVELMVRAVSYLVTAVVVVVVVLMALRWILLKSSPFIENHSLNT